MEFVANLVVFVPLGLLAAFLWPKPLELVADATSRCGRAHVHTGHAACHPGACHGAIAGHRKHGRCA